MYDMVSFMIPGKPCPKGRPRYTREGRAYTPKETREYEEFVRECYATSKRTDFGEIPVEIRILAKFKIPKSASKKRAQAMREGSILPTVKPDLDNVVKSILDSLNGLAYKDDAQVTDLKIYKRYADEPMVIVMIQAAGETSVGEIERSVS